MPKILYSSASPYSAKARMAATHAGYAFNSVTVDTNADPDILIDANPLGKIPTLITNDGTVVFDSRAIVQFINRETKGAILPRNAVKRTEAETLEALADGLCDCLLAHIYERRFRPEEKIHQPWLDKQWEKAGRVLDTLNASPPRLTKKANGGQIALRAALGYLALRFPGQWERGRARLVRWARRFDERFPELAEFLPR